MLRPKVRAMYQNCFHTKGNYVEYVLTNYTYVTIVINQQTFIYQFVYVSLMYKRK